MREPWLWPLAERIRTDWRLLGPILLANVAGIVYGYYYYWDVGQFDPASPFYRSPFWWPLIADSPNAVLVMSAALVAAKLGRRSKWLDGAGFLLMVYVGLWTTMLFLLYPERLNTFAWHLWPENANPLLFVTHMGMPLEALLLVPALRRDRWPAGQNIAVVAACVAFVAVDYLGPHLHPAPFLHLCPTCTGGDGALHAWSPWLMVATLAGWLAVRSKRK